MLIMITQFQSTHRCLIFMQYLVVLAHRNTEYNRSYVLETMNPLLALRPLTPDIKQPENNNHHHHVVIPQSYTLVLKPSFSPSLSLHRHLSLTQANLLEFVYSVVTRGSGIGECGRLTGIWVHYNIVIFTYLHTGIQTKGWQQWSPPKFQTGRNPFLICSFSALTLSPVRPKNRLQIPVRSKYRPAGLWFIPVKPKYQLGNFEEITC